MDPNNVSVGLAFIAGIASFISPCVLSLVPAYIGYLSGRAVSAGGNGQAVAAENRWVTVSHGLAFVLGFSAIFISLGMTASALGAALYDIKPWLVRIGGIAVIVFGLHTMGVIHIPFLEYDTRRQQPPDPKWGYLSSALMGVFFSAGWAPCVGPVLGAVLTLALDSNGIQRGAVLLTAYSAGLGVPFLLAAAGVGSVSQFLRRYGKYLRYVSIATGIFLIIIGIMLFTDSMQLFARFAPVTQFQYAVDEGIVSFWQWITGTK